MAVKCIGPGRTLQSAKATIDALDLAFGGRLMIPDYVLGMALAFQQANTGPSPMPKGLARMRINRAARMVAKHGGIVEFEHLIRAEIERGFVLGVLDLAEFWGEDEDGEWTHRARSIIEEMLAGWM